MCKLRRNFPNSGELQPTGSVCNIIEPRCGRVRKCKRNNYDFFYHFLCPLLLITFSLSPPSSVDAVNRASKDTCRARKFFLRYERKRRVREQRNGDYKDSSFRITFLIYSLNTQKSVKQHCCTVQHLDPPH